MHCTATFWENKQNYVIDSTLKDFQSPAIFQQALLMAILERKPFYGLSDLLGPISVYLVRLFSNASTVKGKLA